MFSTKAAHWGARTGVLTLNGREIATPAFVVATTRGAVPHLTPDHDVGAPVGVFAEDLWDARGLVEATVDRDTLPFGSDFVVGAARRPDSRQITSKPNQDEALAIDTAQGARLAPVPAVVRFMTLLRPDVFVVPYDVPAQTTAKVGHNRLHKMVRRSKDWFAQFRATVPAGAPAGASAGVPLLVATVPVELATSDFLNGLDADGYAFASGAAAAAAQPFANPAKLRLGMTAVDWRSVFEEVRHGADLVYAPLTPYADAGHALTLTFAGTTPEFADLHDPRYAVDRAPLGGTGHSLAYVHHLLNAEEMTAQVLLQLHNHAVATQLFADVRASIARGTFDADLDSFLSTYNQAN